MIRGPAQVAALKFLRCFTLLVPFLSLTTVSAQSQQAIATAPVTFTGEVRTRTEADRPSSPLAADVFTYLRTRLGIRVDPTSHVRVFLQVQDSRVLGSEGNTSSNARAANLLEMHQGYVEFSQSARSAYFSLRAGRQEVALGNERLLGVVNWSNLGRSLDGVRLVASARNVVDGVPSWSASLVGATIEERGRRFGTAAASSKSADHVVAGAFFSHSLAAKSQLDLTLFYDGQSVYRQFANSDRGSADTRLKMSLPFQLQGELEAAWQFGHQQRVGADTTMRVSQKVNAWLTGVRVGAKSGILTVGADLLSGDNNAANGSYSAFSTTFGSNHAFYGLMDNFGEPAAGTRERGLVDLLAMSSRVINGPLSIKGELHYFTLQAGDHADLGTELDLALPMRVDRAGVVEIGYGVFRPAGGAELLGIATRNRMRHWGYLQLRASF